MKARGPNAEQIEYWNERVGPKWVALRERIDGQVAPLGLAAMDRAGIAEGERVLDVGCGCGESSLQLAARVGPGGAVTGIDVSSVMLAQARQSARDAGLANLRFVNADAQTHRFEAKGCDVVYSRFGVMFFADPTRAFANLRSALRPGGRLAFLCWRELKRNPWMLVPLRAIAPHVSLPPPPAADAPGPFSFADPARVRDVLGSAGFEEIRIDLLEGQVDVGGGGDLDQTVDFALQMGPAGHALREANGATRERARASLREAFAPYATPQGVRLEYAAGLVLARV